MTTKPGRWGVVPSLTKYPHLWRGCQTFVPFFSDLTSDLILNTGLSLGASSPLLQIGSEGKHLTTDTDGQHLAYSASFNDTHDPRPISVAFRHKTTTAGPVYNNIRELIYNNNYGDPSPNFAISIMDGTTTYEIGLYSASGGYTTSNTINHDDDYHTFVVTWDADNSYTMYRDGALIGSGTKTLSGTSLGYATISGLTSSLGRFRIYGETSYFALWNRVLSGSEAQLLSTEPYAMLEPDPMLGVPLAALMPLGGSQFLPYNKLNISLGLSL